MTDHTPTPWAISEPENSNYLLEIIGFTKRGAEQVICRPPGRQRMGNAKLIVAAVNSHDALVSALASIATFPISSGENMDAVNMKLIAQSALLRSGLLEKTVDPSQRLPSADCGGGK